MGEARRKALATRRGSSEEPGELLVVDTLGGRMHMRWDEAAAATPHGQWVFSAELLAATGLFERWVSSGPLAHRSGNAPDKREVLDVQVSSRQDWGRADNQGDQMVEAELRPHGRSRKRRVVIVRQRIRGDIARERRVDGEHLRRALVCNGWSWYCRAAHPGGRLEAITSGRCGAVKGCGALGPLVAMHQRPDRTGHESANSRGSAASNGVIAGFGLKPR